MSSFTGEPLVAEVQHQELQQQQHLESSSCDAADLDPPSTEDIVPTIQYHRTLYLNADGCPSPNNVPTGLSIHDVLSVSDDCSMASVLPVLSYRREDVFVCVNTGGFLRATAPVLEMLSSRRKLPASSRVVAHRGLLYGVQVEEGVAKVVGTVRQMVTALNPIEEGKWEESLKKMKEGKEWPKLKEKNLNGKYCLLVDGEGATSGKVVRLDSVTFDPAQHVLVTVPLGGYCFVQFKGAAANDDIDIDSGAEESTPLVLLIGTAHLLFTTGPETCSIKWNAYVDSSLKEVVTKSVPPGSTFFQYSGGWILQDSSVEQEEESAGVPPTYLMTGTGLRKCHFMEAYFYAQMHIEQTIKKMDVDEDK